MANNFGIPAAVENRIRTRDTRCVYCHKEFSTLSRKDWPTIEHLSEHPPFYWRLGLKEEGLAICCTSCNSSRGAKSLAAWFRSAYCRDRQPPIGPQSVAPPVRRYLDAIA